MYYPLRHPRVSLVFSASLIGVLLASGQAIRGTSATSDDARAARAPRPAVGEPHAAPGHQPATPGQRPATVPGSSKVQGGAAPAATTAAAPFQLTVDAIMQGPKLVGYPPTGLRWSGDGQRLYFEWRQPNEDETSTWVAARAGGPPRRLTDEERKLAPPVNGQWDTARRRVLAVQDGDIVLLDTVAQTRRALTRTTAAEDNPRWARNETHVTFTRDNSLYLLALTAEGDGLVQLTEAGPRRPDPKPTASQQFLKDEEKALLDAVREDAEKQKKNEDKRKREELPRLDLTERQSVSDLRLAHDETYVYALVVERAQAAKRADVPNYVTVSAYTEEIPARVKVGDTQERRRLAIINLKTKALVWASHEVPGSTTTAPQTTDPKEAGDAAAGAAAGAGSSANVSASGRGGPSAPAGDLQRRPRTGAGGDGAAAGQGGASAPRADQPSDAAAEASKDKTPPGRVLRWAMADVSPDGKLAVAVVRTADNNDRWIVAIDPATGNTRVLDHVHDDAWVRDGGGPQGVGGAGWLGDQRRYWYLSERDGWMHLYAVDVAATGASPVQLTSGRFELASVELSPDRKLFYLSSTEAHPGERHVYTLPVDGGARTKLTSQVGASSVEVSPDGQVLGVIHSSATRPPEVYLMPNQPGAALTQVTTSTSEAWRSFKWVEGQLVTYPARDGAPVYARLYTPEMVGAKRHPSAPAVVFVHGAGYLQNAHKYWSTYYREFMFHHLLASRGYVVLDPDYRASAGYGRDWRTAIYRHMGGKDLEDVNDGAAWLVKTQKVNAKRIGVYGGSYGGFITLMAMFTTPDVFAAGAALRPVTDWAHYNHPYTSNILNEPQDDPEAYRRSSPIYFADKLKGALLICHGMVDVNVHFQDSVRLAQRLIELRKDNWELAAYPVEDHAFERETSWADEYRRILKLFEQHLKKS